MKGYQPSAKQNKLSSIGAGSDGRELSLYPGPVVHSYYVVKILSIFGQDASVQI